MQFADGSMPKPIAPSMPRSARPAPAARRARLAVVSKPADAELSEFLKRIGERVRTMRSRRGMSRKLLARHSKVSERYLAQLEAGKGNFSIVLLRRVAHAIGVPMPELFDERPDRSVDALLLMQFLGRLPPADLAAARDLLLARFSGPSSDMRAQRIALIGLRGSGKSTLGSALAARLNTPFIELDREIERQSGIGLSQLFELFGQEVFRRNERAALETVLQRYPRFVLATGGSLVTEPGTFELLSSSCRTVWLKADPEAHMRRVVEQGDLRPMANNDRAMDDLIAILTSREPLYAKADLILDTAGKTPEQSLKELLALLGNEEQSGMRRSA
jgi:XRE family transcriptional regulator, aerobic/anaerobic benzoate catabolism transcriptional regulator